MEEDIRIIKFESNNNGLNQIVELGKSDNAINDEKLIWDIQPNEPLKEYACFEKYLSLGIKRNLKKVSEILKITYKTIHSYSKRWNWEERAYKHDFLNEQLNRNKELLEMENIKRENSRKMVMLSTGAQAAFTELTLMLQNYWSYCYNEEAIVKVDFLNKLIKTIDKFSKYMDMPLTIEMQNDKTDRDIKINNVLNLNQDMKKICIESRYAYNNLGDIYKIT